MTGGVHRGLPDGGGDGSTSFDDPNATGHTVGTHSFEGIWVETTASNKSNALYAVSIGPEYAVQ